MTPLFISNRTLSDSELSSLTANPFQILRPYTWRDRMKWKIKDFVYFVTWRLLPREWCARIWGENV